MLLIFHSSFDFRSSSTPREKPSSFVPVRKQTCVICGKKQETNEVRKYCICEKPSAQNLIDAAILLKDEVYTRISDLKTVQDIFSADLRYHSFNKYLHKYNYARNPRGTENIEQEKSKRHYFNKYVQFLENIIEQGRGITLSEVRDLIKEEEGVDIFTNEIKLFIKETFGDRIQFCVAERKHQSILVCSPSIIVNDAINLLRNTNVVKEAASKLRHALLNIDFGIDDKFCDSEELKTSWQTIRMPDDLITFEVANDNDEDENEQYDVENAIARVHFKVSLFHSIFQIPYCNVHRGKKNTPFHIMNAAEIYKKCKSRELITSFNRCGVCVSYNSMKRHREALAKYAVRRSEPSGIPLPSHFSLNHFTLAAFDNFDHDDKYTLSGLSSSHNTASHYFK